MFRRGVLVSALFALLLATPALAASPQLNMEAALQEAALTACNPPAGCPMSDFQRQEVVPGIVHYSAILQTGPGMYDKIGIHRVVRENRAGYPIKQVDSIFLQHGDAKNFVGMFLPGLYSPTTPSDYGIAIYLAANGVDVWGIDQGWTLVPADTTDFGFMLDWGLQHAVDDLSQALAVARETRDLMGSGKDRFNLLGYSSGSMTGYALLNQEAAGPKALRNVKGYVAADLGYIFSDPDLVTFIYEDLDLQRNLYDQGVYGGFVIFQLVGNLARNEPNEPSPLIPGLTNLQTALFFGAVPLFGNTPIHYFAGEFDASGLPTGLQYLTVEAYLDFLESAIVWQPTKFWLDIDEVQVGIDTPFDDHLGEIRVPVFNWGAAGGIGPHGTVTLDLLGSKDVSEYLVSTWPPEDVLLDFGHIDLFAANNAPEIAWPPLLNWIKNHR